MADDIWSLHHAGRAVAEFHVTGGDFPWLNARVVALPGFEEVAPLFQDEVRLLDALEETETPEWTAAYERIRDQTRLTYPDGRNVPEFLLHIQDDQAWWRWSDEPFDE